MLRLLIFLVLICAVAFGLTWLIDNPGEVDVTWRGMEYDVSLTVALGMVLGVAIALGVVWSIVRFVLRAPSLISLASRMRRREKGFDALTRGFIALGAGDGRAAQRQANEARGFVGHEPLAKFLTAQAAQMNGDRDAAVAAFNEMLENPETYALGLRGLHLEARRAGDSVAALDYAQRANAFAPLPWAAQAVLDDRAQHADWVGALAAVESNAAQQLIDKPTANRWRAVLKAAIAEQLLERDPKGALIEANEALSLAPGLVPAAVVAGKLLGAEGDYRRASKVIETAFKETPHPELAAAYLRIRHGDSTRDRLTRARALARVAPFDPESQMTIARAAIEAHDLPAARQALTPILRGDAGLNRPTARVCLMAAEIEEIEGNPGAVREWLSRAARAPRDRAWVADGVISDHWAPISPSGQIDGFAWKTPDERLTAPAEFALRTPPAPVPAPDAPAAATSEPAAPAPDVVRPNSGAVVMLPSAAPDDPGPPRAQANADYRYLASE